MRRIIFQNGAQSDAAVSTCVRETESPHDARAMLTSDPGDVHVRGVRGVAEEEQGGGALP